MEKNKTGKYFKYAIGEIILVVLGILIALSINNWNESRKLKAEEYVLLNNLSTSYKRKLTELEKLNAGRKENIKSILKLIEIIQSKNKNIDQKEFYAYRRDLFVWYAVNEEFSIIDMLFSSGKINTLSNDSLKSKLIEWPDKMEEMLEEQRVLKDLVTKELNPLIRKYVASLNFSQRLTDIVNSEDFGSQSPFLDDFEGLLNDRLFESLIAEKYIYLITNINDTNVLIDDAKYILKLIEDEFKL